MAQTTRRKPTTSRGGTRKRTNRSNRSNGSNRSNRSASASRTNRSVSDVAAKMKGPALAGGAALAGLAGGVVLGSRRSSSQKVLGMRIGNGAAKATKNLADAGRSVSRVSENLGQFAAEIHQTREALQSRPKQRSPIEVVLQGLTARR